MEGDTYGGISLGAYVGTETINRRRRRPLRSFITVSSWALVVEGPSARTATRDLRQNHGSDNTSNLIRTKHENQKIRETGRRLRDFYLLEGCRKVILGKNDRPLSRNTNIDS